MQVHVRETSRQEVAQTTTESFFVKQAGNVVGVKFCASGIPAAGESMTVDVDQGGVSVLTAAIVYDNPDPENTWVEGALDGAAVAVTEGALMTVTRTYAAGGGPTPIAQNEVVVEFGP